MFELYEQLYVVFLTSPTEALQIPRTVSRIIIIVVLFLSKLIFIRLRQMTDLLSVTFNFFFTAMIFFPKFLELEQHHFEGPKFSVSLLTWMKLAVDDRYFRYH